MTNYNKSKDISKQILDLLKVESSDCSKVKEWIANNEYAQDVMNDLADSAKLSESVIYFSCEELKSKSKLKLEKSIARNKRVRFVKRTISIAAAILFLSFLVENFMSNQETQPENGRVVVVGQQTKINEPTLILSNGKKINLNDMAVISDAQMTIQKSNNSSISYVGTVAADKPQINTLIVPQQCKYTVMLSDGTKVVVNANSKLTYPLVFSKDSREVKLEGEGYFEVAKGDVPFIVESQGVNVKVYGTKFNINSYSANCVKTMLFEGSVGVRSTLLDSDEYIMKKNQVSEMKPISGELTVGEFSSIDYKSWVDGYFYSDGETLEELLVSLSNWYNVEFTFINTIIKESPLVGVFRNDLPIEDILSTIEKVLKIKFIRNERGFMVN